MNTKTQNQGIFAFDKKILTKYNEEYVFWEPKTSKLSAALHKGLKETHLKQKNIVLYLGASTGTTVTHISNIVGNEGMIFAIEISPTTCRELVFLAEERKNIAPILADANQPQTYANSIITVDWLCQDISQRNQVEIFLKNAKLFLKEKGYALLALKARSINVAKEPNEIFKEAKQPLSKEFEILEEITLEPYQKDHCLFVCRKR